MIKMAQRIKTFVYLYFNLFLLRDTPVLVYAPGRTGSISMIYALQTAKVFSIKVEWLNYKTRGTVRFCKKFIVSPRKKAKVITLVRDPVEILSSLFFSKACRGHLKLGHDAVSARDLGGLLVAFEKEVLESKLFHDHLYWYEEEFEPNLKLNVFQTPFNASRKYGLIEDDVYPTLIMRTDLSDEEKVVQVNKFLNLNKFSLDRLNVKSSRKHGDLYAEFVSNLKLSDHWLDKIYNSSYSQHFFTETEIRTSRKKFTQN